MLAACRSVAESRADGLQDQLNAVEEDFVVSSAPWGACVAPLTPGARQVLKEEFDEVRAEQLQEIQRLRGELRFDSQPLVSRAMFDGSPQRRSGRHGARWRWRVGGRDAQGNRGGARHARSHWTP